MTLSARERQDATGQNLLEDFHNNVQAVLSRATFGMVTNVRHGRVPRLSARHP